jgi:hypothetical protein
MSQEEHLIRNRDDGDLVADQVDRLATQEEPEIARLAQGRVVEGDALEDAARLGEDAGGRRGGLVVS